MAGKLTPRQAAEAIEQFGEDLAKLINAFDAVANRMPDGFVDVINGIPHQDQLDTIAEAFRERGDQLCRDSDAADEAEEWAALASHDGGEG
ncbi:hypothetical protein [Phenylobacterium immobile]|uniref:hypothetical protein n=1 Tax=Phenylobacterium immobile TaxID=21 RepID=UPI000B1CBAF3|nr:hypothetical protein [Phenylobacterium immobile]